MEKKVYKLNTAQSFLALAIFVALLIGLYYGIKQVAYNRNQPEIEKAIVSKDMNSDEMMGMAIVTSKKYITQRLTSPASADFQSNPDVKYIGDSSYIVNGYVDAQNSFGAKIRNYYIAKIKYLYGDDNQKWTMIDLQMK